ncbi:hypothetical protein [Prevotella sp. P3-122]|jgi:hypothetical protein|uniref:hypothetical protein n=1 Tax=Prevotella sp. P3-122 TaxID=2024223 RepID=UPI000B970EAF|nr:hypothetical protein [Prevotella sp. P3-122]OYP59264.1 hypothetical protein CIL02_11335 [Prevotella sp. P3-122]
MSKYDFIKAGNLLYWNDPDNGISSGDYKVISVPEEVHEDSIILIASRHSEAEVFASELSPIPQTRSHKEEFLKWREKQEADGSVFYNRLSDVIATEFDLEVGDMVAFTNDYGVVFGPCEILAFGKPWNGDRCVYLDSDAYWFADRPSQLTLISKRASE